MDLWDNMARRWVRVDEDRPDNRAAENGALRVTWMLSLPLLLILAFLFGAGMGR